MTKISTVHFDIKKSVRQVYRSSGPLNILDVFSLKKNSRIDEEISVYLKLRNLWNSVKFRHI